MFQKATTQERILRKSSLQQFFAKALNINTSFKYMFEFSGNRCVAHCPGGCINGQCSSPNFCICNAGYTKDLSVKGGNMCVKRARRSAIMWNLIPKQDE